MVGSAVAELVETIELRRPLVAVAWSGATSSGVGDPILWLRMMRVEPRAELLASRVDLSVASLTRSRRDFRGF